MKKNDIKDLNGKPKDELLKMLGESKSKLQELIFDFHAGKVKNVKSVGVLKKDIARILTFINAK